MRGGGGERERGREREREGRKKEVHLDLNRLKIRKQVDSFSWFNLNSNPEFASSAEATPVGKQLKQFSGFKGEYSTDLKGNIYAK